MIADIDIELARLADAHAIAHLSREAIEYGLRWSWTETRVTRAIRNRSTNVIVARDGAVLSGFAIMVYRNDEAHLHLLGVAARWRRHGIGSALMAWLEVTVVTAGIGRIRVETRATNTVAREFYVRHGFKETSLWRGYYQGLDDAVQMTKTLWAT